MSDAISTRRAQPTVILVATDLSDLDRLVPFAPQQAQQSDGRIILLHVLGPTARVAVDPLGMPSYDPGGASDFAIKTLEPWRIRERAQDIACDALYAKGNPHSRSSQRRASSTRIVSFLGPGAGAR